MAERANKINKAVLKCRMMLNKYEKKSCYGEKHKPEQCITNDGYYSFKHNIYPMFYVKWIPWYCYNILSKKV